MTVALVITDYLASRNVYKLLTALAEKVAGTLILSNETNLRFHDIKSFLFFLSLSLYLFVFEPCRPNALPESSITMQNEEQLRLAHPTDVSRVRYALAPSKLLDRQKVVIE
jgi:hypothetical protein